MLLYQWSICMNINIVNIVNKRYYVFSLVENFAKFLRNLVLLMESTTIVSAFVCITSSRWVRQIRHTPWADRGQYVYSLSTGITFNFCLGLFEKWKPYQNSRSEWCQLQSINMCIWSTMCFKNVNVVNSLCYLAINLYIIKTFGDQNEWYIFVN